MMRLFGTTVIFLLLTALLGTAQAAEPGLRKVIIDQDAFGPATSNLQSVAMVIQAPGTQVLGITVTSGDGWRDENVAHTLRLLEIIGRPDIPVLPGAVVPLVNSQAATKLWESLYGKLVYKGAWMESWPNSTGPRPTYHGPSVVPKFAEGAPALKADPRLAANFLIEQAHRYPGEITLLAAGPLTNLALAARLDPEFPALLKELVIMGGSFQPRAVKPSEFALEYLYTPRLEFNFRWDPEAAHIVFHSPWKKVTLVPIDPTTRTELTPALIAQAAAGTAPLAKYLKAYATPGYPMWDELAAAVFLDPALVTQSTILRVDVDTTFTASYGNTISWGPKSAPGLGEQAVTVVQEVDVPKVEALFVRLMQAPTPPAPSR